MYSLSDNDFKLVDNILVAFKLHLFFYFEIYRLHVVQQGRYHTCM